MSPQARKYFIWQVSGTLLSQHQFTEGKILPPGRLLITALALPKEVSFMQRNKRAQGSTDMSYQIRAEGHLNRSWQEYLKG